MIDGLSRTNDVMSSANVTYSISFSSTLFPFIRTLLRIEIQDNNSKTMIKEEEFVVNTQLHNHFLHYRG